MRTPPQRPPDAEFLGLRLARCAAGEFADWVAAAGEARARARIAYLNAATFNLACDSPEMARLLQAMDCVYADGKSVVWASRWLGAPVPERISAADFVLAFMSGCAARGLKIALVGGRPGEAERAAERYRRESPGLNVVLVRDGFFPPEKNDDALEEIRRADPDIVLLGMGSPLQERLAAAWSEKDAPRVWWCVGALFEYFAGSRPRAPKWIRAAGMEWAFRLALEPGRLWRRYLIGNPKFIWRVLRRRGPQLPPSQ